MKKQPAFHAAAKPLAAAVLMALATPAAFAAVSATQLPGVGYVAYGTNVKAATLADANSTTKLPKGALAVSAGQAGAVVIQWGGSKPAATSAATINPNGTAGFNIGQSATVAFGATKAGSKTDKAGAILNIDATGNPSQILGTLTDLNSAQALYVANANGIVVGSGAVITAPGGLGLINADETSSQAQAVFTSAQVVPISFEGATGGVTVSAGADLNPVDTGLLIAGAGNVNVNGAFVSQGGRTVYSINDLAPLTIDAGVGGYGTVTAFNVHDSAGAGITSGFSNLSTTNYENGFMYQDAGSSSVALNLGTAQSPFNAAAPLSVNADGNINIAAGSNLANVGQATFNWIDGTLTNEGVLNYGSQTSSALSPTSAVAIIGTGDGNIYNNTSTGTKVTQGPTTYLNAAGAFVNGSSGTINAGAISFTGDAFTNDGTLQMGDAGQAPGLGIVATAGAINLAGTTSVVSANGYAGATYLGDVALDAAFVPQQSVSIDTSPLLVSGGPAIISATNVALSSSITVNGGNFYFEPFAAATPVSGSFTVNSGATLSADSLHMGTAFQTAAPASGVAPYTAMTSYNLAGDLVATGGGNPANATVSMGHSKTAKGQAAVYNISGAGSITAGSLMINNLKGSVNNITTGQILANGFQLNAAGGKTGTMSIGVTADGSQVQGFNVNVMGNATINSGGTLAVDTQSPAQNKNYTQYLTPANQNSNLVVQASGDLTVNAGDQMYGSGSLPGSFFQWPGLVYLQANGGQLTSTTAIANAYGAQAATGHAGVFLVANNITDGSPIYTNGNAGIVFAAPYDASSGIYPYAQMINGVNPSIADPGLPTVYFATQNSVTGNANYSFQTVQPGQTKEYFNNEKGYQQQYGTFLTLGKGQ